MDDGPAELLDRFVWALSRLELDAFVSLWDERATAILPSPQLPRRCAGIDEVRDGFALLFDAMRAASGRAAPPYLDLEPRDVEVQALDGGEVVVVTFHLALDGVVGRRTLVAGRAAGGAWRVHHLHASNVAPPS